MKRLTRLASMACAMALAATPALAQDVLVYPAKDQSAKQQQKDESECYTWARDRTGFDPMKVPTASSPRPQQSASPGRNALRGATVGYTVAAIRDKKRSKAATRGAAAGALFGGMRRKGEQKKQQQWEQEQLAQYSSQRNTYDRAYGACLEGRGYIVK